MLQKTAIRPLRKKGKKGKEKLCEILSTISNQEKLEGKEKLRRVADDEDKQHSIEYTRCNEDAANGDAMQYRHGIPAIHRGAETGARAEEAEGDADGDDRVHLDAQLVPAGGDKNTRDGEQDEGHEEAADGRPEHDVLPVAQHLLVANAREGVVCRETLGGELRRAGVALLIGVGVGRGVASGLGTGRVEERLVLRVAP